MRVDAISPGTIRKPPPIPKKPDNSAGTEAISDDLRGVVAIALRAGVALVLTRAKHEDADDHHEQREKKQQLLPSTILPIAEPTSAPANSGHAVHRRRIAI